MKACWFKAPVAAQGQLKRAHRFVDGAAFIKGFTVATRRKQHLVFGPVPARIEGCPGQKLPGPRRNRPSSFNNFF